MTAPKSSRFIPLSIAVFLANQTVFAQSPSSPDDAQTETPASTKTSIPSDETQQQTISFRVREKGSGKTVRRAEVVLGSQRLFADRDGIAKLEFQRSSGALKVKISRAGYVTLEREIFADEIGKTIDVFLVSTQARTTVVVTGKDEISTSKKLISIEEAKKVAPGGDPASVVKVLPGVQTSNRFGPPQNTSRSRSTTVNAGGNLTARGGQAQGRYIGPPATGNAGISVRGSPPEDSKFYIDDFEIPIVYHSIIDLSVVPGSLLSDVQFEAGGFGARFGNAGGGIIKLNTRSDIPEKWSGEGVLNLPFYAGIFYRTKLTDDQAISVAIRRSYVDLFLNAILNARAERTGQQSFSIAPYAQDASVLHTQKTSDGVRKILVLYAEDGVKAAFSRKYSSGSEQSLNIDAYTRGVTAGVSQEGQFTDKLSYKTSPQYVHTETSASFSQNIIAVNVHKFRVPTELESSLGLSNKLFVGFDPEYSWISQNTEFKNLPGRTSSFSIEQKNKFEVGNPATWIAFSTKLGDFTAVPSLRGSYNTQIKRFSLDPRFNATYELTNVHSLKTAVGQFSRAPTFDQASVKYGNPALKHERNMHYIVGVESRWNDDYTTEFQAFLKETYDVVKDDRTSKFLNSGRREAWGLEVFARKNLTDRFFGWVTYTYSKTQEQQKPGEPYQRSPLDQAHVANIVTSYRFAPTWEGAARYKYNTGGTYVPSGGGIYDATRDNYTALNIMEEKELEPNQTMTFYFTKEFLEDTWKWSLRLGMESFWFKPLVNSMRANYDLSKDTAVNSISNIPFIEFQAVM